MKSLTVLAVAFHVLLSIAISITNQKTFRRPFSTYGTLQSFNRYNSYFGCQRICSTRRYCVGTELTPLPQPFEGERRDSDTSWQTIKQDNIIPVKKDNKFAVRPELITFDAYDTLIIPSQSIGRWYRELLNSACSMQIRLPRPELFTKAFKAAYAERAAAYPCFGAKNGMSSREWWYAVVEKTYKTTENLNQIDHSEIDELLPELFERLYDDVFGTREGWILKENVEYTLNKLTEWRDQGSGPKLGVLSNFDDRLPNILADLGISKHFDFILTSYECKEEKPSAELFNLALQKVQLSSSAAAYHVGDSIDNDIVGAAAANWTPIHINENFDAGFPDWTEIETNSQADEGAKKRSDLMEWGRRDISRNNLEWFEVWGLDDILYLFGFPDDPLMPIKTTIIRGFLDD
eukprot:gene4677-6571_t